MPTPPSLGASPPEGYAPTPPSVGASPPEGYAPTPPEGYVPGPPEGYVPGPPPEGYVPGPPEGYVPGPPPEGYVPGPPEGYEPTPPEFVPGPPYFLPPVVFPPPAKPPPYSGPGITLWCVAKPTVPDPIVQEAMNYACGSGADCHSIQPEGTCYQPDTLLSHASFAFNSYWQRTKANGGTCDFGGTAMLITQDPNEDKSEIGSSFQ
ncbi:major pollen allergen Ole e 10-like [Aristolochia californica]|uniref:major pollen allergen Ole e 10-like n=1 Tax=Aristolochia californica TaxID=171875 RepID=UPI0035E3AC63